MIDILVACPASCATGGPEALHSFVHLLNEVEGVSARLWYREATDNPCPEEYKRYHCDYVTAFEDCDVLIVPEIWANEVLDYDCIRCIYWLGVDAYDSWNADKGKFLQDENIIHIAQSGYAWDFLRQLGVERLVKCTDTVNEAFYEPYEGFERDDVILYNPAKETPFARQIRTVSGHTFKPIQGMTRSEVIDAMHHAKLYIDFGEFPGRERIPREAALCGCCLITSKIGSADYFEDFKHNYKFDSKPSHVWAILHKIDYILNHYDECIEDFRVFREDLIEDKHRVPLQVRGVVHAIQYYYPGT